jgi:hypothetical protein
MALQVPVVIGLMQEVVLKTEVHVYTASRPATPAALRMGEKSDASNLFDEEVRDTSNLNVM